MKKISFWLCLFTFAAGLARGQDAATQQQFDQLNGKIQDLIDTQAVQAKRLDALEKEIGELQDKSSGSGAVASASAEDLKKLAEQVQELAKKQQDDRDLILKEIEKLGKVAGAAPVRKSPPSVSTTPVDGSTPSSNSPQKGYEYVVQTGDTLSAIAKAYRAQGIKVTTEQIQKANPGMNPHSLFVGKKIFIPAPGQ